MAAPRRLRTLAIFLSLTTHEGAVGGAAAQSTLIAVASNFQSTAQDLAEAFEAQTGHEVRLTAGSTGKLFAQITLGAPFDVFLAADSVRPERLELEGHAVAGSRRTYAFGRLALWSAKTDRVALRENLDLPPLVLETHAYRSLALAQPDLAPYGAAALEALSALRLDVDLTGQNTKRVMGENVGQVFALVATGNADLGFVALSQVRAWAASGQTPGSLWIVPEALYQPIRQDAVLLNRARTNEAANAFLTFLASEPARAMMETAGYRAPLR